MQNSTPFAETWLLVFQNDQNQWLKRNEDAYEYNLWNQCRCEFSGANISNDTTIEIL